ncbi:SdiA-regulated domain-containing protein [Rhodocytophaga aerolata]|uniref:SdiA-regulated domain-containing protein n=1 Tax=Rhodocytophaga aerolata TaxID=455078 RepID=A0ABT8RDW2_9BACT|nr:SdiA-regulated domain-containing protein [Rhodocytophaga aerolata]MDO1449423.1 SdiA-regulated domain-containing protein [Rhodocytophaga aerolata]
MYTWIKGIAMVLVAVASLSFLWQNTGQTFFNRAESKSPYDYSEDGKTKKKNSHVVTATDVRIESSWQLPEVLREVSGIAYLSANKIACVQDELGNIYIYNLASHSIEQVIPFADAGDYEGITLVENTAYVVRSDGRLFKVDNLLSAQPKVTQFESFLTAEQDVEGLCYDAANHRLLLSIKGVDPHSQAYKGVYAFDLASNELQTQPVYKLLLHDPVLAAAYSPKSKKSALQPSDIDIHPLTGDIYITEAVHHQLLLLNADGELKMVYSLAKPDFAKPEGITFSPTGEIFISNEGKKGAGNIRKINLPQQQ